MTRTRLLFLVGFSAVAIAATRQAQATIYYVTYTGTASGTDTNGIFGTPGATLNGVAFTSTYTYDPSQFGNAVQNTSSSYVQVYGGTYYGGITDPILMATVTINGHSFNQSGASAGADAMVSDSNTIGTTSGPYMQEHVYGSTGDLFDCGFLNGLPAPSFTAVQSFGLLPGPQSGQFDYNTEHITLNDSHVSVTAGPPVPVPEPASLALLAGAAGVFGMALGTIRIMSRPFV